MSAQSHDKQQRLTPSMIEDLRPGAAWRDDEVCNPLTYVWKLRELCDLALKGLSSPSHVATTESAPQSLAPCESTQAESVTPAPTAGVDKRLPATVAAQLQQDLFAHPSAGPIPVMSSTVMLAIQELRRLQTACDKHSEAEILLEPSATGRADELFDEVKRAQGIIDRLKAMREKILTRRCTSPKIGQSACDCCQHHYHALGEETGDTATDKALKRISTTDGTASKP